MLKIDIDDREVRQALEDLRRRASDMRPAMHAIGQALMEGSRERILAGKDWTGQPSRPTATLARKKGSKPLINERQFVDGRLFFDAEADSVTVGASAVLQFSATGRSATCRW